MNIFEDLIDELKKENLLEATVIENSRAEKEAEMFDEEVIEAQTFLENYSKEEKTIDGEFPPEPNKVLVQTDDFAVSSGSYIPYDSQSQAVKKETPQPPVNEAELYRKRATDEVSCLQIVEHILSGVEREQMKVVPKQYDDLEVTKSLHNFLQISKDVHSPEHAQAEFQLMQETESWYSVLSHRDKHISVTHLRRFCETTRPALSSPALVALARFYRNSPYSESVRNKFDFVVTRLFSEEIGDEKRKVSLSQNELIKSLTQLYAEWESISVYANEENDSKILITTLKFEDFITEAEIAETFDELVKNDFFNRLRIFKESTLEQFFVALVTATAIESNVRIGNQYIKLLKTEKDKGEAEKLENKYGFLHDQVISDATSKTFQLVESLKPEDEKYDLPDKNDDAELSEQTSDSKNTKVAPTKQPKKWYFVNKWLVTATILVIVSSIVLFIWANNNATQEKVSKDVKEVNLENSFLKVYIQEARISKESFYAVVLPNWNETTKEKKEEILKKILVIGNEKNYKSVYLINQQGIAVGSASGENVEIR